METYIIRRPVDAINGLFEYLYFSFARPSWSCDITRACRCGKSLAEEYASWFSGAEAVSA